MSLTRPAFVLFGLNLLDAIMTIIWVRAGIAPEGNQLMASLLDVGDLTFLGFKLAMGAFTTAVLIYGSHFRLARYGLTAALVAYVGVMGVHVFIGYLAFDYISTALPNLLHINVAIPTDLQ